MNGFELCEAVRAITSAPILFLSCMDDEEDKIRGLMAGGEDYITKPYSLKELAARVYAQLYQEVWRTGKPDNANTVAVHMTRLRHKLEEAEPVIGRIETVRGEGYRFLPKVEAGTIL